MFLITMELASGSLEELAAYVSNLLKDTKLADGEENRKQFNEKYEGIVNCSMNRLGEYIV